MRKILSIFLLLTAIFVFYSCKESNVESTEYADWQNRNEEYFKKIYNMARDSIAQGKSWKIINKYSIGDTTDSSNYIVVKVLKESDEGDTSSPLLTDTAVVDYAGYLMPSSEHDTRPFPFYPTNVGYSFDKSYTGTYDYDTMRPVSGCGWIVGFQTALLNMHPGDRWLVYIPYNLGYGSTAKTGIPAYSTLIFDLHLDRFVHPQKKS